MPARITKTHKDGSVDVEVTCDKCGEPIVGSNEYGMYCKNKCNQEADKEAFKILDKMINDLVIDFPH